MILWEYRYSILVMYSDGFIIVSRHPIGWWWCSGIWGNSLFEPGRSPSLGWEGSPRQPRSADLACATALPWVRTNGLHSCLQWKPEVLIGYKQLCSTKLIWSLCDFCIHHVISSPMSSFLLILLLQVLWSHSCNVWWGAPSLGQRRTLHSLQHWGEYAATVYPPYKIHSIWLRFGMFQSSQKFSPWEISPNFAPIFAGESMSIRPFLMPGIYIMYPILIQLNCRNYRCRSTMRTRVMEVWPSWTLNPAWPRPSPLLGTGSSMELLHSLS